MAALESGDDACAKRPRADEEGNQGNTVAGEVALESDGSAGAKRLRAGKEGNQGDAAAAAAAGSAAEDRISELVDDLKLLILTLLPLKSAIRTAALSRGWRRLRERRWQDPSSLHYHLVARAAPSPRKLLELLESRGGRRLDRFSLIIETSMMATRGFRSCLECAARCGVEDLHVELRRPATAKLIFHFPTSSPLLARLSLRSISVSGMHYKGAQPFSFLEVIILYDVGINDRTLRKMVTLCPCLRVLNLRFCDELFNVSAVVEGLNLRSLTVAECDVYMLDAVPLTSLCSFCYSGSFLSSLYLPWDAPFTDLYICYDDIPKRPAWSDNTVSFDKWYDNTLSNTSKLTVLTICSNTLQMVSSLTDAGENAELAKVAHFQMLTELQLLMFEMKALNLANIYAFLKNCPCPKLERLFVQLQLRRTTSYDYVKPLVDDVVEEPPEVGLENLKVVKIVNFKWNCTGVQLVSFLLRKASSLHTLLLLVSPNSVPSDVPVIQQAHHLLIEEAVANGQIILSKSDDAATQPFHSELFAEPFRPDIFA